MALDLVSVRINFPFLILCILFFLNLVLFPHLSFFLPVTFFSLNCLVFLLLHPLPFKVLVNEICGIEFLQLCKCSLSALSNGYLWLLNPLK